MHKERLSQMCKRLRQLFHERTQCEQLVMESTPMVAASLLTRTVRDTQKHPYYYLSASIEGRSRHRYVPLNEARTWQGRAQRWQQFSHAMARWVKLTREIETTLRALGQERCVPLPEGQKPRRRQRRRKDSRHKHV